MTLLFFDGLTNVNVMRKPEWGSYSYVNQMTGRDGSPNGAGNNNGSFSWPKVAGFPATTIICGFAMNGTNADIYNSSNQLSAIEYQINGTSYLTLKVNGSGYLELKRGDGAGTVIATGTTPLSVGQWNQIQMKATLHTSTGYAEVKLNGKTEIVFSGQTSTLTGQITNLYQRNFSYAMYYDDIWICDGVDATATQGDKNNDFLGDLKVLALYPTAPGDQSAWTPSSAVANWTTVDENPPNTSDYVSAAGASALQDLYNVTDIPATATKVFGFRHGFYTQKADAGDCFVKPIWKDPNGSIVSGAIKALLTTWTSQYGDAVYKKASGAQFSMAEINAIQFGFESA